MKSLPERELHDDLKEWSRLRMENAVQDSFESGLFDSLLVEAKPAWVLPFRLLIGKIRQRGEAVARVWFICGDCPTDYLSSENASTAREAARHFALKWQLDARRSESPDRSLSEKAAALYELTAEDGFWQTE